MPAHRSLMESGGDDRHGFEIKMERHSNLIRMRLWGFWDRNLAEHFGSSLIRLGSTFGGSPWAVLVDSRQFVAQTQEVTKIRQDVMAQIRSIGCTRVAALVEAAIYTMQFKRIAHSSQMDSAVFHDERAALHWLREVRDVSDET